MHWEDSFAWEDALRLGETVKQTQLKQTRSWKKRLQNGISKRSMDSALKEEFSESSIHQGQAIWEELGIEWSGLCTKSWRPCSRNRWSVTKCSTLCWLKRPTSSTVDLWRETTMMLAKDEEPLTPNHLLQLQPCSSLPLGIFDKEDMYCQHRRKQAQYLSNLFWKQWIREFLPTQHLVVSTRK